MIGPAGKVVDDYVKPVLVAALTALLTGVVGVIVKRLEKKYAPDDEKKKDDDKAKGAKP